MWDFDEDSFITLSDENGNEVDFLLLDVMEYEGSDYMVLLPLTDEEDEQDEEELFFLHVEKTDEGEVYSSIEDEALLTAIADAYEKEFIQKMKESGTAPAEDEE
ncbi:MAG: DUF1292 domain-containing protein [Aristaeellaceae bacterium]